MSRWTGFVCLVCVACAGDDFIVPEEQELAAPIWDEYCGSEIDHESDGVVDQLQEFSYENDGLRWRMVDRWPDGTFISEEVFDVDHAGRLVYMSSLFEQEGVLERWQEWMVRDSFGRLLRDEIDEDGDGHADQVETVTAWTTSGKPAAATTVPAAANGRVTRSWTYDAIDRVDTIVSLDADGGEVTRTVYTYDDAARTRVRDTIVDGALTSRMTVTFDAQGRWKSYTFEGPGRTPATTELHVSGDRVLSETTNWGGHQVSTTTYLYDCN